MHNPINNDKGLFISNIIKLYTYVGQICKLLTFMWEKIDLKKN